MKKAVVIIIIAFIFAILLIGLISKNVLFSPLQKFTDRNTKSPINSLPASCNAPKEQVQQLLNTINTGKNKQ